MVTGGHAARVALTSGRTEWYALATTTGRGEKAQKCTCERRSESERGSDAFGCAAFVAAFPIAQWHAHLTRTAAAAAAGADVRSPPPPPSPHARTLSAGHLRSTGWPRGHHRSRHRRRPTPRHEPVSSG
ncbi:hypothetical protein NECAME_17625 [Necator americanus]|uniref:Uncharacterized protein n=1 Tax=Necator americanus TaxID=51031 RepID=W2TL67_NECAM|nr:hypothetical protein NECAME_17625 [Necator americanus]ETN82830.1 hypothetical protein NECAME_17625 [Necator americanus]